MAFWGKKTESVATDTRMNKQVMSMSYDKHSVFVVLPNSIAVTRTIQIL